jgi:hypothetical protein
MALGYFDLDGRPIDRDTWAALTEAGRRRLLLADLGGRGRVSTIWLGLDLGSGWGPPELFETLVMGGPWDGFCLRYATRAAAEAGHRAAVRQLRTGPRPRPLLHNGRKP